MIELGNQDQIATLECIVVVDYIPYGLTSTNPLGSDKILQWSFFLSPVGMAGIQCEDSD